MIRGIPGLRKSCPVWCTGITGPVVSSIKTFFHGFGLELSDHLIKVLGTEWKIMVKFYLNIFFHSLPVKNSLKLQFNRIFLNYKNFPLFSFPLQFSYCFSHSILWFLLITRLFVYNNILTESTLCYCTFAI